ncbi:MAG: hypothetical protein ACLRMH_13615 [Lachnospiraceae bacterium]
MDKSDAVIQLIKDGALICTMAQNPNVMVMKACMQRSPLLMMGK